MSAALRELEPQEVEKALEVLANGGTLADSIGANEKVLEAGYTLAYNYIQAGNYEDAKNLLVALTIYNHKDPRFFIALGTCLQMQNEFYLAIEAYYAATVLTNANDPSPIYNMAVCFMKLGRKDEAITTLETISRIDKDDSNKKTIEISMELLTLLK